MRIDRTDPEHHQAATIDIETTHYDPSKGETISVGVGVHDRGTPGSAATYEHFHRKSVDDEAEIIRRGLQQLDEYGADVLVSYNGIGFDVDFLSKRLGSLGVDVVSPALHQSGDHVDLFADRKEIASSRGESWPNLETCLESYGHTPATTIWDGQAVENSRFDEELGPAYLEAVRNGNSDDAEKLTEVIDHYLVTDLEANLALFYADLGEEFQTHYLGSRREF